MFISCLRREDRRGLSLMEVLLSLFVLGIIIAPVYLTFSGSRQVMGTARDLTTAVSLAGSLFAGLKAVPAETLPEIGMTADLDLPAAISLERLGVASAPVPFERTVSLSRLDSTGNEGGPYLQAEVVLQWQRKTGPKHRYTLVGLLKAKP